MTEEVAGVKFAGLENNGLKNDGVEQEHMYAFKVIWVLFEAFWGNLSSSVIDSIDT